MARANRSREAWRIDIETGDIEKGPWWGARCGRSFGLGRNASATGRSHSNWESPSLKNLQRSAISPISPVSHRRARSLSWVAPSCLSAIDSPATGRAMLSWAALWFLSPSTFRRMAGVDL